MSKKRLVVFIIYLSSLGLIQESQSGVPEQDPVVNQLRERFRKAKKPTVEQLIHRSWLCKEFFATIDNYTVMERPSFFFQKFAGLLQTKSASIAFDERFYISTDSELTRNYSSYGNDYALSWRIDAGGNLIGEFSYSPPHIDMRSTPLSSSAGKDFLVATYAICISKNQEE